jgi:hypothetical protein
VKLSKKGREVEKSLKVVSEPILLNVFLFFLLYFMNLEHTHEDVSCIYVAQERLKCGGLF